MRPTPLLALCVFVASSVAFAQTAPDDMGAEPAADSAPTPADPEPANAPPWPEPSTAAASTEVAADLATAEARLKMGRYREAATLLAAVVKAEPTNVRALERLREAAVRGGANAAAESATVHLVDAYLTLHDGGLANQRFDELIAAAPEHPERARLEEALGRNIRPRSDESTWSERARSALGIVVLLGICFALSNNRRKINPRVVLWGLTLQTLFGLFVLQSSLGEGLFDGVRVVVDKILSFTDEGASFLFGSVYQGIAPGPTQGPVSYVDGTSGDIKSFGLIFAFHVLPTIVFFGSLMSVLYHLGILQKIVKGIAWLMQKAMNTSGAESLSAAGNIFVGQTEAPLLVRPYLHNMTNSELMAIMVGGFATVAGGVMAAYVRFGIDAGHLLAASVMSAPAGLMVAKIIFPQTEIAPTAGGSVQDPEKTTTNVIDAAAAGATDGLKLAANVAAMLIAFMALLAMVNAGLGLVGPWVGLDDLSLRKIFGVLFYPISWAMGVSSSDLLNFGNLLGTKIAINEFVAYVELGALRHEITPRTFTIGTFALCGFANFSSVGIQIGGIAALAPHRRADLARLGLKAMFGGAIATALSGCVAGLMM